MAPGGLREVLRRSGRDDFEGGDGNDFDSRGGFEFLVSRGFWWFGSLFRIPALWSGCLGERVCAVGFPVRFRHGVAAREGTWQENWRFKQKVKKKEKKRRKNNCK